MNHLVSICLMMVGLSSAALAQAQAPATLGDSAKEILGSWEFSNAGHDKTCTAIFKRDPTAIGFKVEFDANCASQFPLVRDVAGWIFPDNDLLRLLDAQGKSLVEFSEVEDGIYEAPTPGVGVLFLQAAGAAGVPPPRAPAEVAGNWAVARGNALLCALTLTPDAVKDGFTLTVNPGCAASIAQLNFAQWRMDRGELVLVTARGTSWRFEEIEGGNWRRLPESANPILLVKQ